MFAGAPGSSGVAGTSWAGLVRGPRGDTSWDRARPTSAERHFLGRARPTSAGRHFLGRGAGADGLRVPATRVLPGHVLTAPSVVINHPTFTEAVSRARTAEGASAREPWVLPLLPPLVGPCSPGGRSRRPARCRDEIVACSSVVACRRTFSAPHSSPCVASSSVRRSVPTFRRRSSRSSLHSLLTSRTYTPDIVLCALANECAHSATAICAGSREPVRTDKRGAYGVRPG
jgi:hypothetical protein